MNIKENEDGTVTLEGIDQELMEVFVIGLTHYCSKWNHPNYAKSRTKAEELRDKIDEWFMEGMD